MTGAVMTWCILSAAERSCVCSLSGSEWLLRREDGGGCKEELEDIVCDELVSFFLACEGAAGGGGSITLQRYLFTVERAKRLSRLAREGGA